jgi:hypothetical protein
MFRARPAALQFAARYNEISKHLLSGEIDVITINGDVHITNVYQGEAPQEELPEGASLVAMTDEERDLILAALRFWQAAEAKDIPLEIMEIACNGRESCLTDRQIDDLCEDLKTEPVLKTRIRSSEKHGAWVEAWLRGSWQKVCGTETYGDLDKVEAWVMEVAPHEAVAIMVEHSRWRSKAPDVREAKVAA